jgi:ABC-type multidrug transport system fused ATPase/permease subunit
MSDMNSWMALRSSMQQSSGHARRRVRRETIRRVVDLARDRRGTIVAFLILATLSAVFGVATPVLAGQAVNAIIDGDRLRTVVVIAVVIGVIAVASMVVGLLERVKSAALGEGIIFDLRRRVFEHMQSMPVAFFMRTHTGALVSRLNNDVVGAQRAFTSALAGVVTNAIALVLTLTVMLRLSWIVTLVAAVLLPLFIIPARRVGAKVGVLERESNQLNAAMVSQMTERFSAPGATLVKLFGRPSEEAAEFAGRAGRVRDIGVRTAMATSVFMNTLALVSGLAQAIIYGLGGYLAYTGRLDPGTVVTLALLLNRLYAPLTALANARIDVVTAMVSFERVFEVLDIEPLIRESPDAVALPDGPVGVEIDHVRFRYPSADQISLASLEEVAVLDERVNETVLDGVSFEIPVGHTVALVGASGAGKSTVASLVSRLYDVDEGAIRIGGTDVRDATAESLRRTIGVVSQDGHLFHDTIASNLRYARPDATDDEVWQVIERARLGELVRSLPDGIDTVVGERGYRFSGGERQRLTIARVLLAQPRIVILDEATSSLDSTSEAAVQAALGEALAGRTALVIAHRLSTVRAADSIVVLDAGKVAEIGTHDELLAANGRYATLYRTQFAEEPSQPEFLLVGDDECRCDPRCCAA